ncbi:endochitinase-like [Gordionus sp. m RMFG-2023]|uniref:endochitinase-like n=1 Tax=Gordionus sp. m RMFG-2023 TaxID=3053472 RepID=UPI0031FD829A
MDKKSLGNDKIVIGLAFYSITWKLKNSNNIGVGAESLGPGYGVDIRLPWNYINVAAWDRYWDDIPKVPYAVKGIQWLSYDNETSLEAKIEWMCQKNYQGVMINDIAMEKTQTLIQFVRNAINYYCGESTTVTNPASTTTEEWYTPTTTDNNPDCSTDTDTICNNGQLLAKYPPDCNKYVDCRAQERPIMSFPSDLQFDEVNQYCDYEYNVHCIPCETSHIR